MLYLAFIFHMHQPYYKNLLTQEVEVPWVRLHGVKDYLDMVQILEKYPQVHQTFNLVPCLIEQLDDYAKQTVKDRFLELSLKPVSRLSQEEKRFILEKFFMINKEKVISIFPRYYELYLKKQAGRKFDEQDYLDLQVCFNLAWIDPSLRQESPELREIMDKARYFSEEDKQIVLNNQLKILENIIPTYKKFIERGQVEVTVSPYYHPITPLVYNTRIAKEADPKVNLPQANFSYPPDARYHIEEAVKLYREKFGVLPQGMWPSEEAVSEHVVPLFIESGINWIVTDEAILFKSLKKKKRDTRLLYQPHLLKREEGELNVIFRDRNLSDLIGFVYHSWNAQEAANDLMRHLDDINIAFKGRDVLVAIAMDGENAWEYYTNDGHDFLNALYKRLSDSKNIKSVTVSEYLKSHPATLEIKYLAAGSWIYGNFGKWIGNSTKNKAWGYLTEARKELEGIANDDKRLAISDKLNLAYKQIYIAEGSDWFWWYGEDNVDFDQLFRMHLSNFYTIINRNIPPYLKSPL